MRITAAEHRSQPVGRLKGREIAIADEIEKRPVGIERARVARHQRADRQPIENAAGVALNRLVVSAAGRGELGLRRRRRLIRRAESQVQHAARGRDRIDGLDFAGPFVVRRGRAADQRTRDLAESVTLAPAELHAFGRRALRRLAHRQRVERAGADRNDLGHGGRRRVAKDVNLRATVGRGRLSLARGGPLGRFRLRNVWLSGDGLARLGRRRRRLASISLEGGLARRRSFEIVGWSSLEIRFDEFGGAAAAVGLGCRLVMERRLVGRDRRRCAVLGGRNRFGRRQDCVVPRRRRFGAGGEGRGVRHRRVVGFEGRRLHGLQRQASPMRAGRVDLLAEHPKAAIAQEFAMAAEQRRRRKSDQPAPSPARERPADRDVGEGLPPGDHADELVAALEFGAAEQRLHGLAAVGALAPTAAASAGCAGPNRPSSSRVHKKRDLGGGDSPKSGGAGSSDCGALVKLDARGSQGRN